MIEEKKMDRILHMNLNVQHRPYMDEIMSAVQEVISSGMFILGEEVKRFEQLMAEYCHTEYAVGVANGTDSLILIMRYLGIGPGDEVITAPNSYLASASSVALLGATPVFADVRKDQNLDPEKLEAAITPNTKAIMVVHLTGMPADMDPIMEIANRHGIPVIEDAAQAVGAEYKGKRVGSFGLAGSFSLHPLKNLNACGDAGVITTNDKGLYDWLQKARNHGLRSRDECEFWSINSRLDALQAAILNVKMKYIEDWNEGRRKHAARYRELLAGLEDVVYVPQEPEGFKPVYHAFVIQTPRRDELAAYLNEWNITTKIHYPIPIHLMESAAYLGYEAGSFPETEKQMNEILTIPVFPELTDEQIVYIADRIKAFFNR